MTPQALALADVLLQHHRYVCVKTPVPYYTACLITHRDLCERAGVPELTRSVNVYLREIAGWCTDNGWPPIIALAVNGATRTPDDSYDLAPGCCLELWPNDVELCAAFREYPEKVEPQAS